MLVHLAKLPERLTADRARPIVALACVAMLGWTGARYAETVIERTRWIEACLANPSACAGRKVFLSLVEVETLHADGYTVRKVVTPIRILGDPGPRKVGSTISLTARFEPGVGLVELESMAHPRRGEKKVLGAVGTLAAALAALFGLRPTRQGLVFRG